MSDPILLVDDDPVQRRLNGAALQKAGYQTIEAEDGEVAMATLRAGKPVCALLLDLMMPKMDGLAVMEAMKAEGFSQPVIVQTAKGGIDIVISAMRAGAFDFVVKPAAPDRLKDALEKALKLETRTKAIEKNKAPLVQAELPEGFKHLSSRNPIMARAIRLGQKAASSDIPVVLEGETGVGKEVFAKAIQAASQRYQKPFVTVNCGAIPENLVESTLFGHEKGSFTGATDRKIGKFVEADAGTLFLDEIGDLPLDAQVKLLRALQEGEVDPIGGKKAVPVDIRIIAATHRDLLSEAREGTFREDLYFRLNVFPIRIPALRERREDIADLVHLFLHNYTVSENKPALKGIAPDALAMLARYDWPGNIRELQNTIFRAVVLCDGHALTIDDFPQIAVHVANGDSNMNSDFALNSQFAEQDMLQWQNDQTGLLEEPLLQEPSVGLNFLDDHGDIRTLSAIEKDAIEMAVAHCNGQMSEVARKLGIGRSTLYRKLQDLQIDPKETTQAG